MKRKTIFLVFLLVSLLLTGCTINTYNQDDESINYSIVQDEILNNFVFAYDNQLYMSPDTTPLLSIDKGPSEKTLAYLKEKFFNKEYFETKALLFLEFETCSSEIEASKEIGGITTNKVVFKDNKFTVVFNIASENINNDDHVIIPFVLEIEKKYLEKYNLDFNISKYEVDIKVINSLSSSRGSYHYDTYKQKGAIKSKNLYSVVVKDPNHYIIEPLMSNYKPGAKVTIKTNIFHDVDLNLYINGKFVSQQKPIKKDGYYTHWEFYFVMPEHNITIEFKTSGGMLPLYYIENPIFIPAANAKFNHPFEFGVESSIESLDDITNIDELLSNANININKDYYCALYYTRVESTMYRGWDNVSYSDLFIENGDIYITRHYNVERGGFLTAVSYYPELILIPKDWCNVIKNKVNYSINVSMTYTDDYRFTALDYEKIDMIKLAYIKSNYSSDAMPLIENVHIEKVYGEYNGASVIMISDDFINYTDDYWTEVIGGVTIDYYNGNFILVFYDGKLYRLQEAYDKQILTHNDILMIARLQTPYYSKYYSLSTMKGLEVYAWKLNDEWFFGLLSGTNRKRTDDEIIYLYPVTIDTMKSILNSYGLENDMISLKIVKKVIINKKIELNYIDDSLQEEILKDKLGIKRQDYVYYQTWKDDNYGYFVSTADGYYKTYTFYNLNKSNQFIDSSKVTNCHCYKSFNELEIIFSNNLHSKYVFGEDVFDNYYIATVKRTSPDSSYIAVLYKDVKVFGDEVNITRLYLRGDLVAMDVEIEAIDFYLIPKTSQCFNAEDLAFYQIKDENTSTIQLE